MRHILHPDAVRKLTQQYRIRQEQEGRYHTGDNWRKNADKMQRAEREIIADGIGGLPVFVIAASLGVSEECISKRLRKAGIYRKKGRPSKSISHEPSQKANILRSHHAKGSLRQSGWKILAEL